MFRTLYIAILILAASTSISDAFTAKATNTHTTNESKPENSTQKITNYTTVRNIVLDKIDNGYIYSKNGQVYKINHQTQIINNFNRDSSKIRIAEIFFQGGIVVAISIK